MCQEREKTGEEEGTVGGTQNERAWRSFERLQVNEGVKANLQGIGLRPALHLFTPSLQKPKVNGQINTAHRSGIRGARLWLAQKLFHCT